MVLAAQAISLLYQYWIHTELIDRIPGFGLVFNTPSHHRVHHGRNAQYLDRNHGGILIIWDRLFGTFEPERAPVDYGLTTNLETAIADQMISALLSLGVVRSRSPVKSKVGTAQVTTE